MGNRFRYEICIESIQGLQVALAAGADRVELCSNLSLGGTTPSAGLIQAACERDLEVVVLLRPRAGDFVLSDAEFDVLTRDLEFAKQHDAAGVALGVLTPEGEVDLERCAELMRLADPMPVCFHRAFDFVRDQSLALEQLIELGVARVLTSGGAADVVQGQEALGRLVTQAGERIEIMPGGGLRADNVQAVLRASGASSIHFSASEFVTGLSQHRNPNCSLQASGRPSEFEIQRTSASLVRALMHAAQA